MKQQSLFPTPLWTTRCTDADQLQRWVDRVMELKAADPIGVQLTNQGGWHSQTNLLQDPGLHDLFSWIAAGVQGALLECGWDLEQAKPCFNNAWAIVNSAGEGLRAHLHPNSLFSGVFYLATPENCGSIAFLDPRGGSQMLLFPQSNDGSTDYQQGRVLREPKPGLLLLFPSWLWHEVEPSKSENSRISISFNVGMSPTGLASHRQDEP